MAAFCLRQRRPGPRREKRHLPETAKRHQAAAVCCLPPRLIRSSAPPFAAAAAGTASAAESFRPGPSSPSRTLLLRPPSPRSGELSPLGPTFSDDIHSTDILDSLRTSTPPCPANAVPRPSPGAAPPQAGTGHARPSDLRPFIFPIRASSRGAVASHTTWPASRPRAAPF